MSLTSYRAAPPRVNLCMNSQNQKRPEAGPLRSGHRKEEMFPADPSGTAICALGRPGSDLLSHTLRCSTIGAEGLHGRVRNGVGCFPLAITTRSTQRANTVPKSGAGMFLDNDICIRYSCTYSFCERPQVPGLSLRTMYAIKPVERLVPVSFTHYCASTPGLSTWWSSTALIGKTSFEGGFPLRCFQRLSLPYLATQLCHWRDNWSTRGTSTPVLSY